MIKKEVNNKKIKNIYKYMNLKNLISTIKNGIFMADPNVLNDPFEYDSLKYIEDFRIGSLTSSFCNKKMWSFYADSHKGCCVQFEIECLNEIEGEIIKRVKYTSYVKHNRNKMTLNETRDYLFHKDKKWSDENEIRALFQKNNLSNNRYFNIDGENKVFLICKIKKVYLGAKCNKNENYLDILNKLNKKRKKLNFSISKMYLSNDRYRIMVNNDFNIEDEIKNIINND